MTEEELLKRIVQEIALQESYEHDEDTLVGASNSILKLLKDEKIKDTDVIPLVKLYIKEKKSPELIETLIEEGALDICKD